MDTLSEPDAVVLELSCFTGSMGCGWDCGCDCGWKCFVDKDEMFVCCGLVTCDGFVVAGYGGGSML